MGGDNEELISKVKLVPDIYSQSSEMKLLTLIIAVFTVAQGLDLQISGLALSAVRQAEELVDKTGEKSRLADGCRAGKNTNEIPCQTVTMPKCEKCQHLVTKINTCGCLESAVCKTNPCPKTLPPMCNSCQVPQPQFDKCGCESKACIKKECPRHKKPTCPECFGANFLYDHCNCPKLECVRKPPITDKTPPTCPICQQEISYKDICNNIRYYCNKIPCQNITIPKCEECQHLVKRNNTCGCLESAVCKKNPWCKSGVYPIVESLQNFVKKLASIRI